MAEEYKKRFGDDWGYFHNPIIISDWVKYQKNYISIKKYPLKIGYFGRIGRANKQSIQLFIDAVSSGKIDTPVELHLFTNFTSHNYNLDIYGLELNFNWLETHWLICYQQSKK